MNIAVDGYAASGKSVIAREIARALDINVFDTGAMYRGIACEWDSQNLGEPTLEKVSTFVKGISISVKFIEGKQHTYINGRDYTDFLRLEKISMLAVLLSPYKVVREKVTEIQRTFASSHDCVMEGRDIGSIVLPNAEYKFFVTAPVEVRAKRRYDQEIINQPDLKYEKVLEDLKKRDYLDKTREVSPLIKVKDSIVIDTGGKTIDESLEECLSYIDNDKKVLKN